MGLKLDYFLNTNFKTIFADWREYNLQSDLLKCLQRKMQDARSNITRNLWDEKRFEQYCFTQGTETSYECESFNIVAGCICCGMQEKNRYYIRTVNEYNAQKKLVDEFWKERMKQRVK